MDASWCTAGRDASRRRKGDSDYSHLRGRPRRLIGAEQSPRLRPRPGRRGRRPMQVESPNLSIVYHGEVYNHRELRRTLEAKGHRFRSSCDTEVVLRAYAEWGDTCVNRLEGMFAFALWDADRRRLFAARD